MCETFSRKLPKMWEITICLEIGLEPITVIATDNNKGVKLEGYDSESVGRRFESCQARHI